MPVYRPVPRNSAILSSVRNRIARSVFSADKVTECVSRFFYNRQLVQISRLEVETLLKLVCLTVVIVQWRRRALNPLNPFERKWTRNLESLRRFEPRTIQSCYRRWRSSCQVVEAGGVRRVVNWLIDEFHAAIFRNILKGRIVAATCSLQKVSRVELVYRASRARPSRPQWEN